MLTLLCLLQSLPPGSVDRDVCRTAVLELHSSSYSIVKPVKSPPTYPRHSTPSSSSLSRLFSVPISLSLSLFASSNTCACLSSLPLRAGNFSKNCSVVFEDPLCFLLLGGAAVMRDHREKEKKEKESALCGESPMDWSLFSKTGHDISTKHVCVTRRCSASPYLTAQI